MKNRELKKKMLKFGGVLISEYPIETPAYPANFPIRNRLITALSDVLLAAPGDNSKGTYITVQKMLDAEKGLCTVSCDKSYSHIAYQKLMLLGAKEVFTSTDVMKLYPVEKRAYLSPEKIISGEYEIRKNAYDNETSAAKKADETAKKTQKTVKETEHEKEDKSELIEIKRKEIIKNFPKGTEKIPLKIFDIIARKESSIEEIIELSAIPAPEVLDHLIRLQIMGIADTANGKIYKVSK
jgi:predicted Rossmann fold nucleotide-binding protein DprA/Smf involved in DNA uptake